MQLRKIPYIDRDGLVHAVTLAVWRCTSYQLYATITATIYKRLKSLARRIRYKDRPKPNLLLKIAALYALDNNDSWYKRCLSMLFNYKGRDLLNHVYYKEKQVDTNKRFLLDQVLQNTLWFQSRVLSPAPRDKSTPSDSKANGHGYARRLRAPHSPGPGSLTTSLNLVWSSVYQVTREELTVLDSAVNSRLRVCCCFEGNHRF